MLDWLVANLLCPNFETNSQILRRGYYVYHDRECTNIVFHCLIPYATFAMHYPCCVCLHIFQVYLQNILHGVANFQHQSPVKSENIGLTLNIVDVYTYIIQLKWSLQKGL